MDNQSGHLQELPDNLSGLVGIRLREERERLEITQADAALLTGVSRQMWGRYERGAMPSAEVFLRLNGQGFDINYILGGSRRLTEGTLKDEERTLIDCFRTVGSDAKAAILRVARNEVQLKQSTYEDAT